MSSTAETAMTDRRQPAGEGDEALRLATPRTDYAATLIQFAVAGKEQYEVVTAHFARELERELTALRSEVERLRGELAAHYDKMRAEYPITWGKSTTAEERIARAYIALSTRSCSECAEFKRLQAKIDALMLEYCPDEMTKDQLEEWGKHQRPAKEDI